MSTFSQDSEAGATSSSFSCQTIVTLGEDFSRMPYKHINDLTTKGLRNRLDSQISHLKSVAVKDVSIRLSPLTCKIMQDDCQG